MPIPKGRIERLFLKGALWLFIIGLLAFCVFLFGSTWGVYQKEQAARIQKEAVSSENQDLLKRKQELEDNLASLESARGIEKEIRERFPVAKSGEEVIVLVDAKKPEVVEEEEKDGGIWGTVKSWFGF